MVVGSNLARRKIFTASIGSVDSFYLSVFIYCVNLYQFLILCTDLPKALKRDSIYNIDMLFLKKGFQAFIYIYYKSFDIHICSIKPGSFIAFCINRLK